MQITSKECGDFTYKVQRNQNMFCLSKLPGRASPYFPDFTLIGHLVPWLCLSDFLSFMYLKCFLYLPSLTKLSKLISCVSIMSYFLIRPFQSILILSSEFSQQKSQFLLRLITHNSALQWSFLQIHTLVAQLEDTMFKGRDLPLWIFLSMF